MNKTGVLWVRVSSVEQSSGYSLDAQLNALKAVANEEGINVVRIFQVAESAKVSDKRKCFRELINFIETNGIQYLVTLSEDRITRNYEDLFKIQRLIDKNGLTVILAKDKRRINRASPSTDRFLFSILGSMAQFDNQQRSEKTKMAMERKAREGGYPTRAPIGYLNIADPNDNRTDLRKKRRIIIVDPERAPLVKWAFEAYNEGAWSLATLRDELNRRGLRTKPTEKYSKGPISKHGLQKILANPFYYGEFRWDERTWPGQHKSLITRELFECVQAKLHENVCNSRGDTGKWFAFKPFLKCGYCGSSITSEIQKGRWGKGHYVYYRCSYGKGNGCPQDYIREEAVDRMFSDALGELYVDETIAEEITRQLKHSHSQQSAWMKKELRRLQSQQTQKRRQLDLIYEDRLSGVITLEQYKTHRQRIENELSQIQVELERLNRHNSSYQEQGSEVLELLKGFKRIYLEQDLKGKAEILKVVLDRCIIKGQDTAFVWKHPFDVLFTIGRLTKEAGVIKGEQWGE
jgi:site-specific DNA recombinase